MLASGAVPRGVQHKLGLDISHSSKLDFRIDAI